MSTPSIRLAGKRLASSTIAKSCPAPEVEHAGARGQARSEAGKPRQHQVDEDPGQRAQAVADLLDQRFAVVLVGHDPAGAQALGELRVVLTAEHEVDSGRPAQVERGVRVTQDRVHVRSHPPSVAVAVEQPERKGGPTEDLGVAGIGPDRSRERRGVDSGAEP